jgi:hypothetical protein
VLLCPSSRSQTSLQSRNKIARQTRKYEEKEEDMEVMSNQDRGT